MFKGDGLLEKVKNVTEFVDPPVDEAKPEEDGADGEQVEKEAEQTEAVDLNENKFTPNAVNVVCAQFKTVS